MAASGRPAEPTVTRRVFGAWSIDIPASLFETHIAEDGYWHAYDDHRSVSLTSMVITDDHGPASAEQLLQQLPTLDGSPIGQLPAGLVGQAVVAAAIQPSRASQVLSGLLVGDGRMLIVTITSDDLTWAQGVWLSIRSHAK